MFASLTGRVAALRLDSAVIDVGGVGYLVYATPATISAWRVGETATAATSVVVREDSITIYGFADDDEREVFEGVQTVSGVGPRLALAMLAVHTPDGIREAIETENLAALQRVPGIGRKGAQRLVLELAGKLGATGSAGSTTARQAGAALPTAVSDAVEDALVGLGWNAKQATTAVAAVVSEGDQRDVSTILRDALQYLGGSRG
ncbi:Holliday junction branch migration protein RuvA [Rarobacter faecitabidus]|uniref:Holliday junction branch migration complex subunit RuvA n=1 Tax=Rarobacter faecitabidus TaxID=13243 RepID=A0A542ZV28_RARFA|nr:Holliday junction branch migration protein RuvA [Rarobacter faecitabidus]TQL64218.1 Holliday junction DNA helicase subunit RuvA [Rarobacter faecitabidus]